MAMTDAEKNTEIKTETTSSEPLKEEVSSTSKPRRRKKVSPEQENLSAEEKPVRKTRKTTKKAETPAAEEPKKKTTRKRKTVTEDSTEEKPKTRRTRKKKTEEVPAEVTVTWLTEEAVIDKVKPEEPVSAEPVAEITAVAAEEMIAGETVLEEIPAENIEILPEAAETTVSEEIPADIPEEITPGEVIPEEIPEEMTTSAEVTEEVITAEEKDLQDSKTEEAEPEPENVTPEETEEVILKQPE